MLNLEECKFIIKIQQEQIDELINKIDKAIEYIKRNYRVLLLSEPPKEAFDINKLLEILGDKE